MRFRYSRVPSTAIVVFITTQAQNVSTQKPNSPVASKPNELAGIPQNVKFVSFANG